MKLFMNVRLLLRIPELLECRKLGVVGVAIVKLRCTAEPSRNITVRDVRKMCMLLRLWRLGKKWKRCRRPISFNPSPEATVSLSVTVTTNATNFSACNAKNIYANFAHVSLSTPTTLTINSDQFSTYTSRNDKYMKRFLRDRVKI